MAVAKELIVPPLGESVSEAAVGRWLKSVGDSVQQDETVVELETEKVTIEVNAPNAGQLIEITAQEGDNVQVGDIIGKVDTNTVTKETSEIPSTSEVKSVSSVESTVVHSQELHAINSPGPSETPSLSPAVRKIVAEKNLDPSKIPATGKGGRITKEDLINFLHKGGETSNNEEAPKKTNASSAHSVDREKRVPMTRLRQTIAKRLKEAQNTAALLTTFNEIDMTEVMSMRGEFKEIFEKKHSVKLGFMSFFVKACVSALKEIPAVNAEINGQDLIYKNYCDIGVAVGTPQGLVVPIIRNAEDKSFKDIEQEIFELAKCARDGKLSVADMTGGTFTITNGGVYGSLMSTPIVNPPQSGILGMHKIQKRPIVVGNDIKIRPMMYIALTYDHRVIDGQEAVTFLVRIKECLENPERLLLGV